MNFKKVFELLIPEFQKNKVDFALIGAHALHFSGVTRTTTDIDFMVLLSRSDLVDQIMKKNLYSTLHKTDNVANYASEFAELGQVDFLYAHRKYALEILKRAESREIFEFKVKVIQPEDFIGLKVQSSSNDPQRYHGDMSDIEKVIKINRDTLDLSIVREYFRLFEREKELDEILEKIK